MLADNMGVNVLRINAAVSAEKTAETCGVESGTRAKHTSGRHATLGRVTGGEVSHYVHWIAGHNEYGLRRTGKDRRHDLTKDDGVALQQLETSFSRLLADARTDHYDTTTCQRIVVTGPDFKGMRKRYGVLYVFCLSFGAGRVFVYQY